MAIKKFVENDKKCGLSITLITEINDQSDILEKISIFGDFGVYVQRSFDIFQGEVEGKKITLTYNTTNKHDKIMYNLLQKSIQKYLSSKL